MEMTNKRREQGEMLIKWYNMKAGSAYRFSGENNQKAINYILDSANEDIPEIKRYFNETISKGVDFRDACYAYIPQAVQMEIPSQPQVAETKLDSSLDFMSKLIVEMLAKTKMDDIQEAIVSKAENAIKSFILDNYEICG